MPRINRGMTKRNVYMADTDWDECQSLAQSRGLTTADVVRMAIRAYLTDQAREAPPPRTVDVDAPVVA